MHSPLQTHFEAALRVLRYLKSAPGAGVVYTKSSIRTVSAYADSDWAKCKMTRRSVSGYCVFVFGGLVSCKSKKQATLSRSSAEAEYRSMACATCEVIWIVKILKDLKFEKVIPVSLFCDNNLVMHEKTKHFDIDVHLIREKVASGLIKTVKVDSESQIADILTKGLSNFQHNELCSNNSATRMPNVVNACLESFPTVYEAHGTHSPASVNEENMNDVDTKVGSTPMESIRAISERFANTAYGFFLGKWVAYPVVANYVRNTWGKYELVKSMLNSSTEIFSFQFNYIDGLDAVLGMSSYARALIEVQVDVELKDDIVDECPKNIDSDVVKNIKKPRQATRGVSVGPKFSHSNPFDLLNSVKKDVDFGTNGRTSNMASKKANSSGFSFWNVEFSSTSTTLIVEKIDKIERLIIDGKVTLMDEEGKPLANVDSSGDHDSEDEVASVDNEMVNFMASKKVGYGTNSLLEQWKETYENDDYDFDPYDDDMYKGHDKIQDICDNLDIKVRGRKKK
ncbi:retrovirus-related pol polyprotein from transposon TNT 1-94 [Tanacetum coccineum]